MSLRIISGECKKRKLFSVPGKMTRPTSDRLREAIFNILYDRVQDAIVLDLFAGTGAFGIEALSRGAEYAVLIDKSPSALSVTERNIQACALENTAKIIRWDITKNLNCLRSMQFLFNLVFIDPPYAQDAVSPTLKNLHASNTLEHQASIVIEHSIFEEVPDMIYGFSMIDQRKYGKTVVSFLRYDMLSKTLNEVNLL